MGGGWRAGGQVRVCRGTRVRVCVRACGLLRRWVCACVISVCAPMCTCAYALVCLVCSRADLSMDFSLFAEPPPVPAAPSLNPVAPRVWRRGEAEVVGGCAGGIEVREGERGEGRRESARARAKERERERERDAHAHIKRAHTHNTQHTGALGYGQNEHRPHDLSFMFELFRMNTLPFCCYFVHIRGFGQVVWSTLHFVVLNPARGIARG